MICSRNWWLISQSYQRIVEHIYINRVYYNQLRRNNLEILDHLLAPNLLSWLTAKQLSYQTNQSLLQSHQIKNLCVKQFLIVFMMIFLRASKKRNLTSKSIYNQRQRIANSVPILFLLSTVQLVEATVRTCVICFKDCLEKKVLISTITARVQYKLNMNVHFKNLHLNPIYQNPIARCKTILNQSLLTLPNKT